MGDDLGVVVVAGLGEALKESLAGGVLLEETLEERSENEERHTDKQKKRRYPYRKCGRECA